MMVGLLKVKYIYIPAGVYYEIYLHPANSLLLRLSVCLSYRLSAAFSIEKLITW